MTRYRLSGEIGRGAMGVVYRAVHPELDRTVALKLLALECLEDGTAVKRFQNEALALAGLHHPNIVSVLDTGTMDGRPYMAMELVEGIDLQTVRDARGPQKLSDVLVWTVQIADALAAIHAAGLIHRDIKPNNVVITPAGHVKVLDFGLVRTQLPQSLTEPGTVVGTPRYLAPEAVIGDAPTSGLDVFAMGLSVHELLTGRAWCPENDAESVMRLILAGKLPDLREEVPGLPEWFLRVHEASIAYKLEERITAAAYLDALRAHGVRASLPPEAAVSAPPLPAIKPSAPLAPPGYTLKVEIGAGAMGVVYRAVQDALSREVALKVMRPGLAATEAFRLRFHREALAMSRVSHASLVKVFDVGDAEGLPYIAMELVNGRSLESCIHALPVDVRRRADAMFEQMLEAMTVLHRAGLTHRDLKPGNVMVTSDWKPVVMDLGLVKDVGGDGTSLTKTGALLGTPGYLAPEVLLGGAASPRSDVWALGCIYFAMVAGRSAFAEETLPALFNAICQVKLPELEVVCADISASQRDFIRLLLSREPADRPEDAGFAHECFRRARAGAVVTPRALSTAGVRSRASGLTRAAERTPRSTSLASGTFKTWRVALAVALTAGLGAAAVMTRGLLVPPPPRPVASVTPVPVAPPSRETQLEAALRSFDAAELHEQLCADLLRRREKSKGAREQVAALVPRWWTKVKAALARSDLKRWVEEAQRDHALGECDDVARRYHLVAELASFLAQCQDLGVDAGVDVGPLYPRSLRPAAELPRIRGPHYDKPEEFAELVSAQKVLAGLLAGGETIGYRYALGAGFVPVFAPKVEVVDGQAGHTVHFWSKNAGSWWSQDLAEVGAPAEHVSYVTPAPLPLRAPGPGERVLLDVCVKHLAPADNLSFTLSRDGRQKGALVAAIPGRIDEDCDCYLEWVDPALLTGPAFVMADYRRCDGLRGAGNVEILWMLFHYVRK